MWCLICTRLHDAVSYMLWAEVMWAYTEMRNKAVPDLASIEQVLSQSLADLLEALSPAMLHQVCLHLKPTHSSPASDEQTAMQSY